MMLSCVRLSAARGSIRRAVQPCAAFLVCAPNSCSVRWGHSPSPAEDLSKRVNRLVASGDSAAAKQMVLDELRVNAVYSDGALAAVLHLHEKQGKLSECSELVSQVLALRPNTTWTNESLLMMILRVQCTGNRVEEATGTFVHMLKHNLVRPRSASVYLRLCCNVGDYTKATAAYAECRQRGIALNVQDFAHLLLFCKKQREPQTTLYWMLSEMSEQIPSLPADTLTGTLMGWARECGLRADEVQIDASTGVCPCCQTTLQGHPFTTAYRAQLLDDIATKLVPNKCKTPKAKRAFDVWQRFVTTTRYDVIIDGANLGYYGLSSWYGIAKRALLLKRGTPPEAIAKKDVTWSSERRFVDVSVNFALIDMAVQEALRRGMRPLVLLHERHLEKHNMSDEDEKIAMRWRQAWQLYATPSGLNDDLCWLYSAVFWTQPSDPADASGGSTPPCTKKPIGSSISRVYVLTNDMMRDHHFQLLSQRSFTRWRDQHRITFRCKRVNDTTELVWQMPAPFTACMQNLKEGAWHVPATQPGSEEEAKASGTPGEDDAASRERTEIEDCASDGDGESIDIQSRSQWICLRRQ